VSRSDPRIGMVAGETSGDLLAGLLLGGMKARWPSLTSQGIGGPKMAAQGFEAWWPHHKLSVFGYVDALLNIRELLSIRKQLGNRLIASRPDVFIGVDAPDFNFGLEASLREQGVKTVHFVCPSIWAWRGERIHKIKRAVSHMLALFPHEPKIYEAAGVPVTYVGHPLADLLPEQPNRAAMRETMRIPLDAPVFALLPGSRQSEVKQLAGLLIETAKRIVQTVPEARFLVPLVTRETRAIFEQARYEADADELPFTLLFGHAQDAMIAADGVIVASGTATLECALLKRPMVITYRMPALSWKLMKRKSYQPYYGLPNILCERFVVPELLQEEATPENLAQALLNLVNDKTAVTALENTFLTLHRSLKQNTAEKAAVAILPLLPRP